MRFMEYLMLQEGDVVLGKFEQRLRAKAGEYKNPDLEPPVSRKDKKPFDHYEAVPTSSGKSAKIVGTRKDGYREHNISTTTLELANIMAKAYNNDGYTAHDVEKISLSDLMK